ncbi:MAG: pantoate--beta-alanine ligase [Nocardioidaceae bacterium]
MEPSLVRNVDELDDALMPSRLASSPVAHVPTMGGLHAGHTSLMRAARTLGDVVVVSVFVNPTQFLPGEDLSRYPRDLEADLELCMREAVDIVFAPEVAAVYPEGTVGGVTIDPGPMGSILEGASRPAHFRGVLTVVAKLFALVRPSHAVFGEKDFQQLALIRAMVRDLCAGVEIVGVPTVRDTDGVALSSRNHFLTPEQRGRARSLWHALSAGKAHEAEGADAVVTAAHAVLDAADGLYLDYLALTDPDLGPAPETGEARLLVAARVGSTRLIDNTCLSLGRAARVSLRG